jgi:hypothetical protein
MDAEGIIKATMILFYHVSEKNGWWFLHNLTRLSVKDMRS